MRYGVFGIGSLIAVACMGPADEDSASNEAGTETVWTVQLKGISG